jgi:hypothetical protein
MAQRRLYEARERLTWVTPGNNVAYAKLPDHGYTTHIQANFTINYTTPFGGATYHSDPWGRFLKYLRILASGVQDYFAVVDGRLLFYWAYLLYKGNIQADTFNPAAGTYDARCILPIHVGLKPEDWYDQSIPIPSVRLTDLQVLAQLGAATDLSATAGVVINSASVTFTSWDIVLDPGETEKTLWPKGLLTPNFQSRNIPITAINSALGFEDEVPVGLWLKRSMFLALDNSSPAEKVDTRISEFGIKYPHLGQTPIQRDWYAQKAYTQYRYGLQTQVAGLGAFEYQDLSNHEFGLNLKGMQRGNVVLGYTTPIANGSILTLHQSLA